jgi:FkbM family methyltransferase
MACRNNGAMSGNDANVLKIVAPFLARWFKQQLTPALNGFLWRRVARRLIKRKSCELVGEARSGAKFYCDLADIIQSYIYFFGVWEPDVSEYLFSRAQADDVFVDVGANVGYYALSMAKRCATVVAVEAAQSVADRLERNRVLNQVDNVLIVRKAAGSSADQMPVFLGPAGNIGQTSLYADQAGSETRIDGMVGCRPLIALLAGIDLQRVRLIKIDIEGAEYPVLLEVLQNRSRFHPGLEVLAEVSMNDLHRFDATPSMLWGEIEKAGMQAHIFYNDYDVASYLRRRPLDAPIELTAPPEGRVDIVLTSRR